MGVTVIRDAENQWLEVPSEWPGKSRADEPGVSYKMVMPPSPERPNVQRIRFDPDHFEPPHSHPEDEVIHLLAGSLKMGTEELVAGDALFIAKETRYSLRAGTAGAEFFRVGMPTNAPAF
jgi:quercetin dioxygenase-like cupin family protein